MLTINTQNNWYKQTTTTNVGTSALEVVFGPADLSFYPKRTVVVQNTGSNPLANLQIQLGATASGPWLAENISATNLANLSSNTSEAYRLEKADRFLRVQAQASGGVTNLTVYVCAVD